MRVKYVLVVVLGRAGRVRLLCLIGRVIFVVLLVSLIVSVFVPLALFVLCLLRHIRLPPPPKQKTSRSMTEVDGQGR